MDGVELVSSAILGIDAEVVEVGGKIFLAHPPTISRIAGAGMYLKKIAEIDNVGDIVEALSSEDLANALSWLLVGSAEKAKEFLDADVNQVAAGIVTCLQMIDPGNFTKLSALSRNVRRLIAKPRS